MCGQEKKKLGLNIIMQRDEEKRFNEINKTRKSIGLNEIKISVGNCMKCGKQMLRFEKFRCGVCINKLDYSNYDDEVFERQRIFNFYLKYKCYKEFKSQYVLG